jgi:alanyl-tRNA synthetase
VPRDAEAYDLWVAQGVAKDRIFEFGAKDNFWQMGDTGPCGPCSEIHYDMGPAASDQSHTDCAFGCDCGRYVEIWNLVFMQFDRDASGKLNPLPKPSIDTGMGLERVTAVLQGVISNYDTDLFTPLIKRAAELTGTGNTHVGTAAPGRPAEQCSAGEAGHKSAASLRVIADHSRATAFLIADGVLPSNEGRGYVLRKIMRRAMRHAWFLGQKRPVVLSEMVREVQKMMSDVYPELTASGQVIRVVNEEERRFHHTMEVGLEKLEGDLEEIRYRSGLFDEGAVQLQHELRQVGKPDRVFRSKEIMQRRPDPGMTPLVYPGDKAFKLYDTFGLPLDFMQDAARDAGLTFDQNGFDHAMQDQRERARVSWRGGAKQSANPVYREVRPTEFLGYDHLELIGCFVLAIIRNGAVVPELVDGQEGEIILDRTPFYADAGGQVGDVGWFLSEFEDFVLAEVRGCYQPVQGVRAHRAMAKSRIIAHDRIRARVNDAVRESTMRNHTATHLLQAGLREVLGKHVKQAGSLVAPDHLRFDFSHFTGVADEELQDIEDLINKEVLRNQKIEVIENVPIDVAINEYKAMALFGEKYGDRVRVIKIGDFSTELCGGTHTNATGEIGLIKVLKEGSVSSGVRRIEAVTGEGSLHHFQKDHKLEGVVASLATHSDAVSPADALKLELDKKDSEIKRLQRELDQARMKSASSTVASVTDKIKDIHGIKVLAHRVDNLERAQMRTLVDQLRDKLGSGVVVLGSATNGNVALIVGVTKDLTQKIQAGKVIGPVAQRVGGKGGGRPDLAEAGGKDPEALDAALAEAYNVVGSLLG